MVMSGVARGPMPRVKMYRCDGCGSQHPYACQKALAEQTATGQDSIMRLSVEIEEGKAENMRLREQTEALQVRAERAEMKAEQYQKQLDDRWAGVVALTNKAVEETAALRAALEGMLTRFGHESWSSVHDVAACEFARKALLAAPEGQRAAEPKIPTDDDTVGAAYARWSPPISELLDPVRISARAFKAGWLAAVEAARR